ncbi:MAG: hypothetical protein U9N02_04325 [Campylobacterota bacterium]|nr:hypothetical protein [Campylobacterota bacterium]
MTNITSFNPYLLIDLVLIILISFATYYNYNKKTYIKVFDYFKIFALISISAKFSIFTGSHLSKWHLILPDTYTILILIGFTINTLIIYFSWSFIYTLSSKFINNQQIKIFFAKIITVIEVIIITTFTVFILMQISVNKKYIYPHLNKSYSYPHIKRFYVKFLNADFANMILHSETGINHKEVILNSFKKSF